MPYVQPLPWTEFMACPICTHNFGFYRRHPISLGCGHSVCRLCLASLYNQQCPFDQSPITMDHKNLPVNSALLRLASMRSGGNCALSEILSVLPSPCVRELKTDDLQCFYVGMACIEHMAMHLFKAINNVENPLSRSMQRKLVTLINCQLMTEEGRLRAMRVSRCIGERAVIEMIMRQQKPIQLNSCLWAAVRGRGCQFLGPVLQEDLLRHLLAALSGGVALSRKSLVMQVVQSLKSEYSQASKTSVGHVVQLLYRASCFNVSKRECESSLMQLKEEFSTYDSLRQEHDSQIVQIAMEAGLRIPPEQWSTLLYGDLIHKSYMQSIIDRLQTPESFKQSIQELVLTLQRNGDMGEFESMRPHLQALANIEISADKPSPTTWPELARTLNAIRHVVDGFVEFEIRIRKDAERRLNQRSSNGVNSFSHTKSEMEPFSENFRSITDREQAFRSGRQMMRPSISTPSFSGRTTTLQHTNFATFRHGPNVGESIPLPSKRFEKQQTQPPTAHVKASHRPNQLPPAKAQKNSTTNSSINNVSPIQKITTSNPMLRTIVAPPPGFEQLRLSQLNGKSSSCSSSNYSSSNSTKSNTTSSSSKLNARVSLLQTNWAQRRYGNVEQRQQLQTAFQNAQLKLSKVTQSPSVATVQKKKSSISLQEKPCNQATAVSSSTRLGVAVGVGIGVPVPASVSVSISVPKVQSQPQPQPQTQPQSQPQPPKDIIDSEARDRQQIEELQQRFNNVLLNSLIKPNGRSSSTSDSGVNSPSQSNADMIEIDLNAKIPDKVDKVDKSKSQQSLLYRASNSNSASSAVSSLFSNSDQYRTDKSLKMKSNEFPNSDRFYNCGRHSDIKLEMPSASASTNFVMEFPKSSQPLQLKVPNISTEKLREIWQVPPDQPEAKTIEEIWKPLLPQKDEQQSDLHDDLEDIWVRQQKRQQDQNHNQNENQQRPLHQQQQQQQQQQPPQQHQHQHQPQQSQHSPSSHAQHAQQHQQHHQQSHSDSPSNSYVSENGFNNSYMDWMFRHNYTCMEAAYLKIAERYPNVGIGPWTDCTNFTSGNCGLNGSCGNSASTGGGAGSNAVAGASTGAIAVAGTGTGAGAAAFNVTMRAAPRAPEPSNLGLSALRLIGSLGDQYNLNAPDTAGPPPSPPRKSALDNAIETYWKDAMEASLGLNTFLPPANTPVLPYPVAEDMGVSRAIRTVLDWRDEFKQESSENPSTATTRQPTP